MRGIRNIIAQQRRSMSTPILHKSLDNTKKIPIKKRGQTDSSYKLKSSYKYMYKHLPIKSFEIQFNDYQKTSGDH